MAEAGNSTTDERSAISVETSDARLDLRRLGQRLHSLVRDSQTESAATDEFVTLAQQLTACPAVVLFGLDSEQQLAADPCGRAPEGISEVVLNSLFAVARRTQDTETAQLIQLDSSGTQIVAAVPLFRRDGKVEVLVALTEYAVNDRRQLGGVLQVLQLLAGFAAQWRGCLDQTRLSEQFELLQGLVSAANGGARTMADGAEMAEAFAEYLANHFASRWVTIGWRQRGNGCRLLGSSHALTAVRGAPITMSLEACLAEGWIKDEPESVERVSSDTHVTDSVRELQALLDSPEIYRVLLRDSEGRNIAACLLLRDDLLHENQVVDLRTVCEFIGPQLALSQLARPSSWQRGLKAWCRLSRATRRAVMLSVAAAALALFAVPVPYRVRCRCEVQPVTRHFVAVPYEGRLNEARVSPGDEVRQGQVLAVMDGREIRLEISAQAAELQRVTKQRDRALANRETAAAQIALLEMQRLQSHMQLYTDRLQNLEIRSPMDGVVISGDPDKLKGARLNMGQTLLEIGPLGNMALELAVPDEKIGQIESPAEVRFRLDAQPFRNWHGRLRRIHSRSELIESENVFVGEVDILGDSAELRPGMRGRARVVAGHRSLGWICFHRAAEQLLFWLGW